MLTEKDSFTFTVNGGNPPKTYLALDITELAEPVIEALKDRYTLFRQATPSSSAVPMVSPASATFEGKASGDAVEVEQPAKRDKSRPRHDHILRKTQELNARLLETGRIPHSGWDEAAIGHILKILPKAPKNVILQAAAQNGPLGREAVYAAAGRSPEQSLNGFTKPVTRCMKELQAKGLLKDGVESLLQQIYDPDVKQFQPVQGLQIPLEVAVLIQKMGLVGSAKPAQ